MPAPDATAVVLPQLLDAIAAEHDAVLRLRQRVAAARALVGDDRGLLPLAADDLETALDALERATRRRCRHLADLGAGACTLGWLCQQVGQPWATMLADHHRGLAEAIADVEADMLDGLLELAGQVAAATPRATRLHVLADATGATPADPTAGREPATTLTATDREVALLALSRPLPLELTAFVR
jgi:hypothetical protein